MVQVQITPPTILLAELTRTGGPKSCRRRAIAGVSAGAIAGCFRWYRTPPTSSPSSTSKARCATSALHRVDARLSTSGEGRHKLLRPAAPRRSRTSEKHVRRGPTKEGRHVTGAKCADARPGRLLAAGGGDGQEPAGRSERQGDRHQLAGRYQPQAGRAGARGERAALRELFSGRIDRDGTGGDRRALAAGQPLPVQDTRLPSFASIVLAMR